MERTKRAFGEFGCALLLAVVGVGGCGGGNTAGGADLTTPPTPDLTVAVPDLTAAVPDLTAAAPDLTAAAPDLVVVVPPDLTTTATPDLVVLPRLKRPSRSSAIA